MAAIYQDGKIDGRDVREWHRACQTAVQANRESRILVAQLEERVQELEKIKNIKCPYCARQYFLTPDGQAIADPYGSD